MCLLSFVRVPSFGVCACIQACGARGCCVVLHVARACVHVFVILTRTHTHEHTQLLRAHKSGKVLEGFQEPQITFPPTFKLNPGENVYDTRYSRFPLDRELSMYPK